MQAIILAAGQGTRLLPLTKDMPKCLVNVNGKSMLERQLDSLALSKKIKEVIIVIGYKGQMIKEQIGNVYQGMEIKYVENDDYEISNNIYSFYLADQLINDNFILLESDIVFEPELLKDISKFENSALLGKYKPFMNGAAATVKKGMVHDIIMTSHQPKNFKISDKYKTINIYTFTHDFYFKYIRPYLSLHIKTFGATDYYEFVLKTLINIHAEVKANIITKAKWYEIDSKEDLKEAEKMFK